MKQHPSLLESSVNPLQLYEKIESIKSTISMTNGDRPELWIQRQNLQDLYHQIILNDINFTIDKKLEQDLWNFVFKAQINYFQSQIKVNSLSLSGAKSGSSDGGNGGSIVATSLDKPLANPQKKAEAQASLSFFLEAARGFYTKLLEDIVLTYDLNDIKQETKQIVSNSFSFCQSFPSVFDKINSRFKLAKQMTNPSEPQNKEKQVLYICQHILTHLGDIARYANLFQQAKNYYMHSIKLVPYLGHPYNQLGILFDSSRTNQLSTVFYYIRSIGTRYTFPLASTNLENFFHKLIDIPLTRYNSSTANATIGKTLAHKDLINLYLQICGTIYSCLLNNKLSRSSNCSKVNLYFDLFKTSFTAFMHTPPLQRDKLDCIQLNQMTAILLYILTLSPAKINANATLAQTIAFEMLAFLVGEFISFYKQLNELVMPSLYLAFSFFESHQGGQYGKEIIKNNKLWLTKTDGGELAKFCHCTIEFLNHLNSDVVEQLEKIAKSDSLELVVKFSPKNYADYPLSEDRLLDGFMPLKQAHKDYSFKNYMKSSQMLSETNESLIRSQRIVSCFEKILLVDEKTDSLESVCFIELKSNGPKFQASSSCPPISTQDLNKIQIQEETKPIKLDLTEEKTESKETTNLSAIELNNQANLDQHSTRKRRQNVAMSSLMNNQPINNTKLNRIPNIDSIDASKSQLNPSNITPINNNNLLSNNYIPVMKNHIPNNMSTQQGANLSSMPSSLNHSSNNNHQFLKNSSINNNNNTMNNLKFMQQQHQPQQPSFFPSASARQFNYNSNHNGTNIPTFNEMNPTSQQRFNQDSNAIMSFNNPSGFPNFLPHTNFQPNLNESVNTKEKINKLNSKFQMQQQNHNQQFQQTNDAQNDPLKSILQQQLQHQQFLQTLMKNQNQQPNLNSQAGHQLYNNSANSHSLNNFPTVYDNNIKPVKSIWPNNTDNTQARTTSNTNNSSNFPSNSINWQQQHTHHQNLRHQYQHPHDIDLASISSPNPSLDTNITNNLINLSNLSLSSSNSNEDLNNQNILSKLLIQQLLDGTKSGGINQNQSNQNEQSSLWSYDNNSHQQQQQRTSQDNRLFKH